MNTLFIIYYRLDIGGIQTKIIDIINYCAKHKPQLRVVLVLREKHQGDRVREINNPQAVVLWYPDTSWSRLPFFFPLYILALAARYSPKAILAFTYIPAMCAIWTKLVFFFKHITVVLSEDWSKPNEISDDLHGNLPYLRKLVFRLLYHRADAICAVNEPIAHMLIRSYHVPKSIIVRVHNWFTPQGYNTRSDRTKKTYDLIYVGRLEPVKNVMYLLLAVKKLISKHPSMTLCVVGSGTEEKRLKQYVNENGLSRKVVFVGFSSDPHSYMAKAKMFVFASKNEGLPIVLLEAMSNRLPLLSYGYPAVNEVVIDGYNGYVYRTQNQLMHYIEMLLRHPDKRKLLGNNGYRIVHRHFSQKNIEEYFQLLRV